MLVVLDVFEYITVPQLFYKQLESWLQVDIYPSKNTKYSAHQLSTEIMISKLCHYQQILNSYMEAGITFKYLIWI